MTSPNKCLYCYRELEGGGKDFHGACSRRFFGKPEPPLLDYTNDEMRQLAVETVLRSIAVTGVQPKIPMNIERERDDPKRSRLTIVGLWGDYILKPPNKNYPSMPENEDLTMHLAGIMGIPVAQHSLIRLKSGELAYITKRFDRDRDGKKLPMEDFCQLTETLTENKYKSSYERAGKVLRFSNRPGYDALLFFEVILFSFLTGNSDMHLKNFSLLTTEKSGTGLSPAYDLLSTKLIIPDDREEMALTLNAKKNRIRKNDFDQFAKNLKIEDRALQNIYRKYSQVISGLGSFIDDSFLEESMKHGFKKLMLENAEKINL